MYVFVCIYVCLCVCVFWVCVCVWAVRIQEVVGWAVLHRLWIKNHSYYLLKINCWILSYPFLFIKKIFQRICFATFCYFLCVFVCVRYCHYFADEIPWWRGNWEGERTADTGNQKLLGKTFRSFFGRCTTTVNGIRKYVI